MLLSVSLSEMIQKTPESPTKMHFALEKIPGFLCGVNPWLVDSVSLGHTTRTGPTWDTGVQQSTALNTIEVIY